MLFKRIFGSGQRPDDGYPLDEIGLAPRAYLAGPQISDFEKKIWGDFWGIANDPERAKQLGIRAAHGGAPFMKVEKGKSYRILLRCLGRSDDCAGGGVPNDSYADSCPLRAPIRLRLIKDLRLAAGLDFVDGRFPAANLRRLP